LVFTVGGKSPEEVAAALSDTAANAANHQFALQIPAGSKTAKFSNLSQYHTHFPPPLNDSASFFLGQFHHTTTGGYVDTIDISLRSLPNGGSEVHAFSLSLIAGAFGDNGQNYKNIMMLMKGLGITNTKHLNNSCPVAGAAQLSTNRPVVEASRRLSEQDQKLDRTPAMSADAKAELVKGTCGQNPKPADCENVDYGSCGNACCSILVKQAYEPAEVMNKINATLQNGGPDGYYTLQETAEHTLGFANLSAYISKFPSPFDSSKDGVFVGQVHHMTSGPAHYNDTINFAFYDSHPASGDAGTYIRATSVSLIGGALGDDGQGYKNIKMILDGALDKYTIVGHFFGSCPNPLAKIFV
jgi:hypothetical protein